MEILDICGESGEPTGRTVERSTAHREGILHRTAHVWIARQKDGVWQVLLQKRSLEKDSFPGLYDTSSAGHIPAGSEPEESALRELREELGIDAAPEQLEQIGTFRISYEEDFHGKPFRDNEFTFVYLYREPVDETALVLQKGEVDEVRWFDLSEVREEIRTSRARFCMSSRGLALLCEFLGVARTAEAGPKKRIVLFTDIGDTIIDEGTEIRDESGTVIHADCIPGARETMRTLYEAGYTIVMVAVGTVQSFHNTMTENGLDDIFSARIISEAVGAEKPDARMFRAAMDALGLTDADRRRIVMVGNNVKRDIRGANLAGLRSVLLTWSKRRPFDEDGADEHPAFKISRPEELIPLLERLEADAEEK